MNDEALNRETRPNPKARRRKTRKLASLEYVGDVIEKLPPTAVDITPRDQVPRDRLGTIPKPYSVADAYEVIHKIGYDAWRRMGYPKRKAALEELKND